MRIPKIIHYCWFGHNNMPSWQVQNINEWKRLFPNYKFIKWSEKNFDIHDHPYAIKAYKQHNWAFVSDYVRLYALKKYGGIYLDTDVKVVKSFSPLLNREAFVGLETPGTINCGLGCGSIPNEKNISAILRIYDKRGMQQDSLKPFSDNIVTVMSNYFVNLGLKNNNRKQNINGCTVFPVDYFNPKNVVTGRIHITSNTYSIHSYANSWTGCSLTKKRRVNIFLGNLIKRIIGPKTYNSLYSLYLHIRKK